METTGTTGLLVFVALCFGAIIGYFLSIYLMIVFTLASLFVLTPFASEPFPSGQDIIRLVLFWSNPAMWTIGILVRLNSHSIPTQILDPTAAFFKTFILR